VHIEVRGQFWFLPLTAKVFRAYAMLGGGMAQVDAKVLINEYDCQDAGTNPAHPEENTPYGPQMWNAYNQCRSGKTTYYNINYHQPVPVDGWKKMGQGFIEGGAGGQLAIGQKMAVTLEAKLMYMIPATGVVIEPELGLSYGF
jgi:hypothetical protein